MKRLIPITLLMLLFQAALPAQVTRLDGSTASAEQLTDSIQSLVTAAGVTGLTVTILNNNDIAYQQAFGYADRKHEDVLQTNHVFYGASLSKAVFGYIATRLHTEGHFDLDRPLQSYLDTLLPEIPFEEAWRGYADLAADEDERYRRLTGRMCLSHTTGLPNWRWITREWTFNSKHPLTFFFDPGERYHYSGEGMALLQFVIERHTGRGLEEWAREYVFEPFAMPLSSYAWRERFEDHYCYGHSPEEDVLPKDKDNASNAAGSLETTPEDYARFVRGLLRAHAAGSPVTELMWTPQVRIHSQRQFGPGAWEETDENDAVELSYGLGWGLLTTPYGPAACKEGHSAGFQHYSIVFPDRSAGVILMSNSDNAESIFKYLLELSIGDTFTPWRWEGYVPFDSPESGQETP